MCALGPTRHAGPTETVGRAVFKFSDPMIVIVGAIVVIGAVLGGFSMAGGHIGALIHPSEFVTIGGAALGGLIVSSPKKVLIDLVKGLLASIKGSPYNKAAYEDSFKCLYDLLRLARRDGMLALEPHISKPEESSIFSKYPKVAHNHHLLHFICGGMGPLDRRDRQAGANGRPAGSRAQGDGRRAPRADARVARRRPTPCPASASWRPCWASWSRWATSTARRRKSATRSARRWSEHSWAFCCRTGLPRRWRRGWSSLGIAESAFFRTIAAIIVGFANNLPPKVAIEMARRGVTREFRPEREELDEWFKEAEAA